MWILGAFEYRRLGTLDLSVSLEIKTVCVLNVCMGPSVSGALAQCIAEPATHMGTSEMRTKTCRETRDH